MISDSCLSILDSMGINIYGVSVTFSPNKAYKAGCSPEKRQVYIGDSFFVSDISAIDAVSIVAHEFIHINKMLSDTVMKVNGCIYLFMK